MSQLLTHHLHKTLLISLLAGLLLGACLIWAEPLNLPDINWLVVLAKASVVLVVTLWVMMIIRRRAADQVTRFLTIGLGFIFLSMWQGILTEVFQPELLVLREPVIETLLLLPGLVLLILGFHRLQSADTEAPGSPDGLLKEQGPPKLWLDGLRTLRRSEDLEKSLAKSWYPPDEIRLLVMAELEGFPRFERRFGDEEAERLMREAAGMILLNLRETDMLCRLTHERLVLSLPQTTPARALELAGQLRRAVEHWSFHTAEENERQKQNLIIGVAVRQPGDTPGDLIQRANLAVRMAAGGSGQSLAS